MKIQIKHRYTGDVIFECEAASVKLAVAKAVEQKVALHYADLSNCDLSQVTVRGGRFDGSSFVRSRFDDSSFVDSSFVRSSFVRSRFVDSSFVRSRFVRSSFDDSRFDDSSFVDSSFVRSSFDDSSFVRSSFVRSSFDDSSFVDSSFDDSSANSLKDSWPEAKVDIFAVLDAAPQEASGLLQALRDGRIDGSVYSGECACLVGTIANIRHCKLDDLPDAIRPDSSRPAERWFLAIRKGDTPESHPIAKITAEWIEEWASRAVEAVEA